MIWSKAVLRFEVNTGLAVFFGLDSSQVIKVHIILKVVLTQFARLGYDHDAYPQHCKAFASVRMLHSLHRVLSDLCSLSGFGCRIVTLHH